MRRLNSVRNRKQAFRFVQELDAFPKVPDSYQETSAASGGLSVVVFAVITFLVISEIRFYSSRQLKFAYDVDPEYQGKLRVNIDMMVAMRCEHVGADILDQTGQNAEMFGQLDEEDVHFGLSPKQNEHFGMARRINAYLREEYHTLHEFLWNSGFSAMDDQLPKWEGSTSEPTDGCRLHGSLVVNKVAGNFHITAGKSVPVFPRGHAHLSLSMRETDYNFSHRILHFSFGDRIGGIVNPLEGEEKITTDAHHMYQYFLQVVPTKVDTMFSTVNTFQYAATESNRSISHDKGSHGVPGIFVKYDLSSLRVHIREDHQPLWQFLVRLCGIVGGIFATSGVLNQVVGAFIDVLCCRYKWGSYGRRITSDEPSLRHTIGSNSITPETPPVGNIFNHIQSETPPPSLVPFSLPPMDIVSGESAAA
jgi:hypothetical protein